MKAESIYLLLSENGIGKYQENAFINKEDAEHYAIFLISTDLAKSYIIKKICLWKKIVE